MLFTFALDPFVRALHGVLPQPHDWIRSFLDDLGLALHSLWNDIFSIFELFVYFSLLSNLELNFTKCVIVPLWEFDADAVRDRLFTLADPLADFQINFAAKYLGVFLGPQSLLLYAVCFSGFGTLSIREILLVESARQRSSSWYSCELAPSGSA